MILKKKDGNGAVAAPKRHVEGTIRFSVQKWPELARGETSLVN